MSRFTAKIGTAGAMLLLGLFGQLRAGDLTERFELTLERVLRGGPPSYTRELAGADDLQEVTSLQSVAHVSWFSRSLAFEINSGRRRSPERRRVPCGN